MLLAVTASTQRDQIVERIIAKFATELPDWPRPPTIPFAGIFNTVFRLFVSGNAERWLRVVVQPGKAHALRETPRPVNVVNAVYV
jgi:hypothetical protein